VSDGRPVSDRQVARLLDPTVVADSAAVHRERRPHTLDVIVGQLGYLADPTT
jgi:hypothetical protein